MKDGDSLPVKDSQVQADDKYVDFKEDLSAVHTDTDWKCEVTDINNMIRMDSR